MVPLEALLKLEREQLTGNMFRMEKTVQQAQHKRYLVLLQLNDHQLTSVSILKRTVGTC